MKTPEEMRTYLLGCKMNNFCFEETIAEGGAKTHHLSYKFTAGTVQEERIAGVAARQGKPAEVGPNDINLGEAQIQTITVYLKKDPNEFLGFTIKDKVGKDYGVAPTEADAIKQDITVGENGVPIGATIWTTGA